MAVKDQVFSLLAGQRGRYLSGQELADSLGVTRAAVWKAIKALQAGGCRIDAVPNRGYALAADTDVLTAQSVSDALPADCAAALRVQVIGRVSSTNAALRELAAAGEAEGRVLIAAEQTAGRGRGARAFYSPAGTGVYLSLLLRPAFAAEAAPLLTTAAALAAAEAVEAVGGRTAGIKWVNDVLVEGHKVAGILTEAVLSLENGGLDYAVLGVGFNLAEPAGGWPAELSGVGGSILPPGAPLPADARSRLCAAFLARFWPLYRALPGRAFVAAYRSRLVMLGKPVNVLRPGSAAPVPATALDIDEACRLRVRWADGSEQTLAGGELSIRL